MTPEELFEQYKNLPETILRKMFKNPHNYAQSMRLQYDDLVSYCLFGLWRACNEFDETRKVKFSSFAFNHIKWNLFTQLRQESVFRRYKSDLHTVEGNAVELLDLDGSPSIDGNLTFHETCPSDSNTLHEVEGNLLYEFVFSRITERQKKIMKLRMEDFTLREIGSKLGLSKEMVRLEILKVKKLVVEQYGEVA